MLCQLYLNYIVTHKTHITKYHYGRLGYQKEKTKEFLLNLINLLIQYKNKWFLCLERTPKLV